MPVEGVALIPRCAECDARWLRADEERWQAHLGCDEHLDSPAELAFYCPDCAERVQRRLRKADRRREAEERRGSCRRPQRLVLYESSTYASSALRPLKRSEPAHIPGSPCDEPLP